VQLSVAAVRSAQEDDKQPWEHDNPIHVKPSRLLKKISYIWYYQNILSRKGWHQIMLLHSHKVMEGKGQRTDCRHKQETCFLIFSNITILTQFELNVYSREVINVTYITILLSWTVEQEGRTQMQTSASKKKGLFPKTKNRGRGWAGYQKYLDYETNKRNKTRLWCKNKTMINK